jgi:flagellar hook assembly protein FlgD
MKLVCSISVALAACFGSFAQAQGVGDSLIINLKNGQRVAIPLSEIRKITFDTLGTSDVKSHPFDGGVRGIHPNPLRTQTSIDFDLPAPGVVTIDIFDDNGNQVRTIQQMANAGLDHINWDGLGDDGLLAPPGTYFFEVRAKKFSTTRKAVMVR